jgi:hypothetical protein
MSETATAMTKKAQAALEKELRNLQTRHRVVNLKPEERERMQELKKLLLGNRVQAN